MLAMRRVFFDGASRPELVLLHCRISEEGAKAGDSSRYSVVMVRAGEEGRREAVLFLPEPPEGKRLLLRYFFSSVENGSEWFSPFYETAIPGDGEELVAVPEKADGNLRAAAGRGNFRLLLPFREPAASVPVRYGFGAMRKKPSLDLCRAELPPNFGPPVVEAPEALSVLKNRPMPYFFYHSLGSGGSLVADKINCARLTLRDEAGDVVCARLLWGDPAWKAQNLTVMDVGKLASSEGDADCYFAEDRGEHLRRRAEALDRLPLPRVFECFVYGPEGAVVEYCFQVVVRRPDGSIGVQWRNRDGGNWRITL